MKNITLILIYLTWFSSSLLRPTSFVNFFSDVHITTMNLAYFNPHTPQLPG